MIKIEPSDSPRIRGAHGPPSATRSSSPRRNTRSSRPVTRLRACHSRASCGRAFRTDPCIDRVRQPSMRRDRCALPSRAGSNPCATTPHPRRRLRDARRHRRHSVDALFSSISRRGPAEPAAAACPSRWTRRSSPPNWRRSRRENVLATPFLGAGAYPHHVPSSSISCCCAPSSTRPTRRTSRRCRRARCRPSSSIRRSSAC